jgi:membrane fusion protein (multidrug efflux system)
VAELEVVPKTIEDEQESRSARRRAALRSPRARVLLGLVAIILVIGGVLTWHHYSVRESTDDAQIEADIIPISARVGGTVKAVHVDDNQPVEAGTVLVELDPTDYEVALRRAEAELANAVANSSAARTNVPIASTTTSSQLQTAGANLGSSQKQVEAAEARLREAQANYTKAAKDLARYKQLVERDEIPRQQYDAAVATEQAARASVDSARAAVASAQSQVAQAEAQVREASTAPQQLAVSRAKAGSAVADVQKNQTAVEQARLNLSYTIIRAPSSGIVDKKSVQPGQIIQAGQPLFALVPFERMWVVANFKETQLKKMRVNQPATIHVDAYGRDYKGHVDSFGGATAARFSLLPPENATGNYVKVVQRVPVKIVFDAGQDPEHLLRPGMSVQPTVITK